MLTGGRRRRFDWIGRRQVIGLLNGGRTYKKCARVQQRRHDLFAEFRAQLGALCGSLSGTSTCRGSQQML